jgi:tetratricopeptide (TPR) repeat protein
MNMSGHTMGTENQTPPDELPAPRKMTGIGNSHLPITASAEAQMWFDQGLNLLHDFWDYESARAFEQSIRVDPRCAMCYWGLYKAESFYHGLAQGYAAPALAKAVAIKGHASKRERLYIEASAAYEEASRSAAPGPLRTKEEQLFHKLVKDYPKETQARLFLTQIAGGKEGLNILQAILKDNPQDSAANHYYIHALESSDHPEQALHSAEILASLAPASGHMVHMPGHIFFRMGDYERAEQSFAAAMDVDERYMREQDVVPDNDWNYVHNLMYAIANLMEEGKLRDATELSAKLSAARGELESTLYVHSTRDSISRLDPALPVALRTADWTQVEEKLKAVPPLTNWPNLDFLAKQLNSFAAGMQALEKHDTTTAASASARFDAELWRMSQQSKDVPPMNMQPAANDGGKSGPPQLKRMSDALLTPLLSVLSIMSLELRASLSGAQGNAAEAKNLFARAALAEKALGYREPPAYIRPVGETEAAALMELGDWAGARAAFERALSERPNSGFALYGIAVCSEKSGKPVAASKEYSDFLTAWKGADPGLAQLTHARAWLATHAV